MRIPCQHTMHDSLLFPRNQGPPVSNPRSAAVSTLPVPRILSQYTVHAPSLPHIVHPPSGPPRLVPCHIPQHPRTRGVHSPLFLPDPGSHSPHVDLAASASCPVPLLPPAVCPRGFIFTWWVVTMYTLLYMSTELSPPPPPVVHTCQPSLPLPPAPCCLFFMFISVSKVRSAVFCSINSP